jgi:hypothetical protein
VHDFNPGITPNGVFWIVQVPDDAVQITDETLAIHVKDVAVVDQFMFPAGTGKVPATVSFDVTYTKSGSSRRVRPTSSDPLSPFTWAGRMWMATNSGTFSVTYSDLSFSAQGNFSSNFLLAGNFGEMGTERNGSFVERDDAEKDDQANSEGDTQDGQISGAASANAQATGSEKVVLALKASRARALRAWKSNP